MLPKSEMENTEKLLNPDISKEERLNALKELSVNFEFGDYVNNHIHTTYSFSPYTPAASVYYAGKAGLSTAGIMDHDSVGGLLEFIEAGKICKMPTTCGFECRTSVKGTPLEGKRLNNPDQVSVAYVTLHGIPHCNIDKCERVLKPLREKRNERNRKMCGRINEIVKPYGLSVDFEKDVLPLSSAAEGGSVTERHVLFALTKKTADNRERKDAVKILDELCGTLPDKVRDKVMTAPDNFYLYDVLGILKSSLVKKIYVDADEELMHITDFVSLAKEVGGIAAYAYLGDVGESPTGDKAAQKFEDDYLDELVAYLKKIGINAITYMPSRNTKAQLDRVMKLCDENGFFQISGEDINSPRQSFVCEAMKDYPHLYDATWALIGHEISATENPENGMFTDKTLNEMPSLSDRIAYFAKIGKNQEI